VSVFGDQVSSIAVPLTAVLALQVHPRQMGYLVALQWLPSLLFGVFAGAWVDRLGRRRRMMILADLGRAVVLATIPVCYALGRLTMQQMYVVAFAVGALSVLFTVSDGTLFQAIVPSGRYVEGQSLIFGSRSLSQVGGPTVAGLLVAAVNAPFAIVVDALSFVGSAVQLAGIRPTEPPRSDGKDGGVTAGLSFIWRTRIVRALLTGVAVINFFYWMFTAAFMLYVVSVIGMGHAWVLGVVIGASAVGAVLGSLLSRRLEKRLGAGLVFVAACLVFTAPLGLVPLAGSVRGLAAVLALIFAAQFASGFGVMALDVTSGAMFAQIIPPTVRSRVSGAFQAINYGMRPPGALLGGLIGAAIGLRAALCIAVGGGVFGALLLIPSPVPRFRLPSVPG